MIILPGWPSCGEIDIMELIGGEEYNDRTVYGTATGRTTAHMPHMEIRAFLTVKCSMMNSTYSPLLEQQLIKWYVDNSLYHTLNIANLSAFHQKFSLF